MKTTDQIKNDKIIELCEKIKSHFMDDENNWETSVALEWAEKGMSYVDEILKIVKRG